MSVFVSALCVIIISVTVSGECPNGWVRYDNSCYRLFRNHPQAWPEAVFMCEEQGGYLASIETKRENGYLQELITEFNVLTTEDVWIGLADVRHEGVFVWESTRKNATFLDWAHGEPNQPKTKQEDCVKLYGKGAHKYADAECSLKYHYLCERPLNENLPVIG
ncbi:perlucin-like protein [Haliotis rufescens]|uniref:perlucin-like protein n=1 Tax=Haliotis rufescens TaxID=6454 RepID=UPI00201F09F5|nr:perlucin-like protein [Haliotis rufescens]